jgi:Anaerobic c4-dicarboxylate membrane transporter
METMPSTKRGWHRARWSNRARLVSKQALHSRPARCPVRSSSWGVWRSSCFRAFSRNCGLCLLYSQAATARALMPLGLSLGIWPLLLIGMFPAVNGYFLIPNYGTIIAAINFDPSGTTRIGKYVINHSFLLPGLVSTAIAVTVGLLIGSMIGLETPH